MQEGQHGPPVVARTLPAHQDSLRLGAYTYMSPRRAVYPDLRNSSRSFLSVSVGGVTYDLSTTVSISNGNFNGTLRDDVTISIP